MTVHSEVIDPPAVVDPPALKGANAVADSEVRGHKHPAMQNGLEEIAWAATLIGLPTVRALPVTAKVLSTVVPRAPTIGRVLTVRPDRKATAPGQHAHPATANGRPTGARLGKVSGPGQSVAAVRSAMVTARRPTIDLLATTAPTSVADRLVTMIARRPTVVQHARRNGRPTATTAMSRARANRPVRLPSEQISGAI